MTRRKAPPVQEAYAALVHIQAGDWDEYVYRLYAALLPRLQVRLGIPLGGTEDGAEDEH